MSGTESPRVDKHCYKFTTRSMRSEEKKEQHIKSKKTKQETLKSNVSLEQVKHKFSMILREMLRTV